MRLMLGIMSCAAISLSEKLPEREAPFNHDPRPLASLRQPP